MTLDRNLEDSSLLLRSKARYGRKSSLLWVAVMAGPMTLLWGCAAVVSSSSSQTFTVSGAITPTAGGSGATVSLNGAATASTTSNSSGNYSFTGVANGAYVVTPSNTGYVFSPANSSATVNGGNVTGVNFTATVGHSVTLNWTGSTSPVVGYNVYRSTVNGSSYSQINSGLVATVSYTDTGVQSGTTYYYVTTAVDSSGVESVFSNQASAFIP